MFFEKKQFILSVPNTKTKILIQGYNEIIIEKPEHKNTKFDSYEQVPLIDEWFQEFCKDKRNTFLNVENRFSEESEQKSFHPTNPFHWNAFCGTLFFDLENGTLTDLKYDDQSLQMLIVDKNNILEHYCKRQFHTFISTQLLVVLLIHFAPCEDEL